jgi:hypothetical protein
MGELSEVFYSLLLTSCIGLILALARMAYKSKCKNIKCCGCIDIERDTQAEEAIDEQTRPSSPRADNNDA